MAASPGGKNSKDTETGRVRDMKSIYLT